jgi:hypothetical protein
MGQYGNQPDFGTIVVILEDIGLNESFPPSAIYVGETFANDGTTTLEVQPVGNEPGDTVIISGISNGTFLPIIVTKIIDKTNVDTNKVLLYR